MPDWDAPAFRDPVFRWFLMTRARYHHGGRSWATWNRTFMPMLIANQVVADGAQGKKTGYWKSPGGGERYGPVYATALFAMNLEVNRTRILPSFPPLDPPLEQDEGDDIEIEINL